MASPTRIASEWFPNTERGVVTGVQGAGVGFGTTVGLILAFNAYTATHSWMMAMSLLGFVPLISLILAFFCFDSDQRPPQTHKRKWKLSDSKFDGDFQLVLKQPVFYRAIIITFAFSWVQQGYSDLTPGHLAVNPPTGLGLGVQTAGNIFSLYSLFFTIGALLSGFIGKYIFKNRLKVEIALGFILAGFFNISVMVPAISSNRGVLIICLILAGFFLSWCSAMAFAYLTQCFPTDVMGRVGGLTEGFGMLGAPLGVVVGSISLNITGRYSIAIAIIFIQCLLSFVLTFFLKKPKVFADKGPLGLM